MRFHWKNRGPRRRVQERARLVQRHAGQHDAAAREPNLRLGPCRPDPGTAERDQLQRRRFLPDGGAEHEPRSGRAAHLDGLHLERVLDRHGRPLQGGAGRVRSDRQLGAVLANEVLAGRVERRLDEVQQAVGDDSDLSVDRRSQLVLHRVRRRAHEPRRLEAVRLRRRLQRLRLLRDRAQLPGRRRRLRHDAAGRLRRRDDPVLQRRRNRQVRLQHQAVRREVQRPRRRLRRHRRQPGRAGPVRPGLRLQPGQMHRALQRQRVPLLPADGLRQERPALQGPGVHRRDLRRRADLLPGDLHRRLQGRGLPGRPGLPDRQVRRPLRGRHLPRDPGLRQRGVRSALLMSPVRRGSDLHHQRDLRRHRLRQGDVHGARSFACAGKCQDGCQGVKCPTGQECTNGACTTPDSGPIVPHPDAGASATGGIRRNRGTNRLGDRRSGRIGRRAMGSAEVSGPAAPGRAGPTALMPAGSRPARATRAEPPGPGGSRCCWRDWHWPADAGARSGLAARSASRRVSTPRSSLPARATGSRSRPSRAEPSCSPDKSRRPSLDRSRGGRRRASPSSRGARSGCRPSGRRCP